MYIKSKTPNEFVNYESNVYQLKESPSLSTKSMCIKWKRQAPNLNEKLQVQSSKFEAPIWITRSDLQKSSLFTQIITKANTRISYINIINKNEIILYVPFATKPTTCFESTTKLIIIEQLWRWLKTFPKVMLTFKTPIANCE
jgi:hypothetical protein